MKGFLNDNALRMVDDALEEVHLAFGRELQVKGQVIYKDGKSTGALGRLVEKS